jgi:hypothetical protein
MVKLMAMDEESFGKKRSDTYGCTYRKRIASHSFMTF